MFKTYMRTPFLHTHIINIKTYKRQEQWRSYVRRRGGQLAPMIYSIDLWPSNDCSTESDGGALPVT